MLPHGLVTPRTWQAAGAAWFGTTVCAVVLNRWQMAQLAACVTTNVFELQLAQVAEFKLFLDFGLNTPYALGSKVVSRLPSGWFAFCGLASAVVSSFKIWVCAHHAANLERRQSLIMSEQLRQSFEPEPMYETFVPLELPPSPVPTPRNMSPKQNLYVSIDFDDEDPVADVFGAPTSKQDKKNRLLKTVSTPTLHAIRKNVAKFDYVAAHEWRRRLSSNKIAVGGTTSALALETSVSYLTSSILADMTP